MGPRMIPRILRRAASSSRAPALALALGAASLSIAATAPSGLFSLEPEATPLAVIRGDGASSAEVAARVVILEGQFPADRELRIWALERIEFRPGFGANDARISFHVGPAPSAKAPEARPAALAFSAEASASSGNLSLRYALPRAERLSVRIVTPSGRTVFARELGARDAGRHDESLSLPALKRSMYVVRVTSGKNVASRRMMLGAR